MISENIHLKPFNTFGIDAIAKKFSRFSNCEELKDLLVEKGKDRLLILGGGSNLLFTGNFNGLVLKNEIKGIDIIEENDEYALVKAGAGEVWHELVLWCIGHDLGGIENLSLIPGSVGASPMQNIGAYGVEIKDVFVELEAMNIQTFEIEKFDRESCNFGYRESVFKKGLKDQYVITSVTYKLSKTHKINASYGAIESELEQMGISNPTIKDISQAVINIRSSKLPDPKQIGNAGSFFKNPVVDISILKNLQKIHTKVPNYPAVEGKVKLAAGWLIEQAGWKGKTLDGYGVHKNQALVLVNYGGAKGEDILALSIRIIEDIKTRYGVELEREVNIIN